MAERAEAWCQMCGPNFCGKDVGLTLDPRDGVRLRTASTHWNVPRKYGPHGELFFFFLKKEPLVLSELVELGPSISAETVKACALIGLHMVAEEDALRSVRDTFPGLGEMWKYGCPKSPVWSGDGYEGERSESTSTLEYYEHNVDNLATEVVGQNWSNEVISLLLEDREVGRMALSCHLSMDFLCQEMWDARRESSESVKSTSSTTEDGYENCIYSMNNIHTSDEDNKHDTNYINKHNDANTDTRKLHL